MGGHCAHSGLAMCPGHGDGIGVTGDDTKDLGALVYGITAIHEEVKEDAFLRRVQETIEKSLSAAPALQLAQLFQNVQPQAAPQETSLEDDENFDAAMDFINSL